MIDAPGPEETRQDILQAVHDHPGLSKTEFCKTMDRSWGTVYHHLEALEEGGEIVVYPYRGRTRLFPPDWDEREMGWLAALREKHSMHILDSMQARIEGASLSELVREVGVSRKIIRRNLETMQQVGLVARVRGRKPRYFVHTAVRDVLDRLRDTVRRRSQD